MTGRVPITEQDLLDAIGLGETLDWEFKSARGGVPRSLWETYSAMANTLGGVIVLGVEERDGVLRIAGLTDPSRTLKTVWDLLNDHGKVSANLCGPGDVSIQQAQGQSVLVMRVRQALRHERPVYAGANPLTGAYRRRHEGDYLCGVDQVGRMFADRSDVPPDSRILPGFGLDDLDTASIQQYRNRFSARAPGHAWLQYDSRELLEKLGGWRRDRHSGEDGLTVAGLLMFGKDESIRAPEGLPRYHVDYQEKLSDLLPGDSVLRLSDAFGKDFAALGDQERLALVIADVEGCVTNVRMQLVSHLHPADLSRMLRGLVARGLLISTGRTRATSYSLATEQQHPGTSSPQIGESSPQIGENSPQIGESSPQIGENSPQIGESSPQIRESSPQIRESSPQITWEPLGPKQSHPLGWRPKSSRSGEVEAAILFICAGRFAPASEIAAILGRSLKNLRDRYLTPMVRQGKLRLLYPQEINHPGQAYSAVAKDE